MLRAAETPSVMIEMLGVLYEIKAATFEICFVSVKRRFRR